MSNSRCVSFCASYLFCLTVVQVDTLLQTSHVALQYSQQAQRFLDGIFTSLTSDLQSRDRIGLPSTSNSESDQPDPTTILTSISDPGPGPARAKDPINMLRALAAVDVRSQNEDAVQAAGRLQPVSMVLGGSVGSGGGVPMGGMTPRRGVMTPRRPGVGGVGIGLGTTPRRGVLSKAATPGAE
jgi:kinetochore protein Mis13/DSN1